MKDIFYNSGASKAILDFVGHSKGTRTKAAIDSGIRNLWLAVFCQAVTDAIGGLSRERMDVLRWAESDIDTHVGSFVSVCAILDLDVVQARRIILSDGLRLVWVVDGKEYGELADAAKAHGVAKSTIRAWCTGHRSRNGEYVYGPRKKCGREVRI